MANMDILAIGDYKVSNDERIRLMNKGYVSDWSLSIESVTSEDSGEYICQINTEPQIISRVVLRVLCRSFALFCFCLLFYFILFFFQM